MKQLHESLLVLPNAWDAASAALVEAAGYSAVATSSAAIAACEGYPDTDSMPSQVALAAVARVVRGTSLPVTADVESGYGLPPASLASALLAAGAVGCNYEDTDHAVGALRPVAAQVARIGELASAHAGELWVNARVDTRSLDEAIERGRAYLAAGASSTYPIFLSSLDDLAAYVQAVGGVVNGLLRPEVTIAELAGVGIRRVSLGSGLFRFAQRRLAEVLADPTLGGVHS